MSDFDQLIKEKVNSKEYSYSAKNWQSFTQKAGWKSGFTLKHGLLTGAAVIVVAVGVYVAVRWTGGEAQQSTNPMQNQPVAETVMEQDSVVGTANEGVTAVAEAQVAEPTTPAVDNPTSPQAKAPKRESNTAETPVTDTVTRDRTPVQKPIRRERITRIFEINPDTIPSNDF